MVIRSLTTLMSMMAERFQSPIIDDLNRKMSSPLFLAGLISDSVVVNTFMEPVGGVGTQRFMWK